jgi:hypothetical protein
MLDQVEAQASFFRKEARKEKNLRKDAEESAAESKKALVIVRNTLQETEAARAAQATQVEEAKAKLEPVTQELATLKGQITAMCRAIFGKQNRPPCTNSSDLNMLSRLD